MLLFRFCLVRQLRRLDAELVATSNNFHQSPGLRPGNRAALLNGYYITVLTTVISIMDMQLGRTPDVFPVYRVFYLAFYQHGG